MSKKERLVFSILLSLPHLSPFFVFYNKELGGGGWRGAKSGPFYSLAAASDAGPHHSHASKDVSLWCLSMNLGFEKTRMEVPELEFF